MIELSMITQWSRWNSMPFYWNALSNHNGKKIKINRRIIWYNLVCMLYCHMQHHNDTIINRRRKTSLSKYLPLTLLQGFEKGYSRFARETELESEQKLQYFDPHSYGHHVVSFLFSWCSTGGPEAHSAGWWLYLLHLISIFSGPQFIMAPIPSAWCGFPYHTRLQLELELYLPSVLTELYNSSTPTRSSTRSLKSHV